MKILIIRMMGLGDVASILIPAVALVQQECPEATIDVMSYAAGNELMQLVPNVNAVLAVNKEQWPEDLNAAITSFMQIAQLVVDQGYSQIINLDTWFMPCFLARVLKDAKQAVLGNYLNCSVTSFLQKLKQQKLQADYFQQPAQYLASSFPHMQDWHTPWWESAKAKHYPEFYLKHCCGFAGEVTINLHIEADLEFKQQAQHKRIIAISARGSKASKQYPQQEALTQLLQQAGYYVWSQFDGSNPMLTTLAHLKVTDLLICVATSTQWLAKLVDCPSLVISGPLPPQVLGAELAPEKNQDCQYCYQNTCPQNIDFACLNIAPLSILAIVENYFVKNPSI